MGAVSQRVEYPGKRGKLVGIITPPEKTDAARPAVILCHSFTGFKEIKHLFVLAEELSKKGFAVLRFDFSDCVGESEGTCEHMQLRSQVEDIMSSIDFIQTKEYVNDDKIGVAGHSLGGAAAIVAAAQDQRIKALVPISAPAKAGMDTIFTEERVKEWKEKGSLMFPSLKRGHVKIDYSFYEDFLNYDGTELIRKTTAPVRIIQGEADDIVPPENAQLLFEHANEPKDLALLKEADHLFTNPAHMDEMIRLTVDWFERHLA